jgi:LemA protein
MIWPIIISIIFAFFYCAIIYNQLIFYKNIVYNSWFQIDINLKLRNDLIPLLVSIAKNYSDYEKNLLKELSELRSNQDSSKSISKKYLVNKELSASFKDFFAIAENYPKLKADKQFLKLQSELSRIESNIAIKRQFYNDAVFKHNTLIMSFPSSIVAKLFKFKLKESFSDDSSYGGVKL